MSPIVVEKFMVDGQTFVLRHHLIDDSKSVVCTDTNAVHYHITSKMKVTDHMGKEIARGKVGCAETWDFFLVGSNEVFTTGYRGVQKAQVAFIKHLLEK